MGGKLLQAPGAEGGHASIVPDVRSRTPMPPELDIVQMLRLPDAKDADKLVLAAVERALAGVCLHPHGDVDGIAVDGLSRRHQLGNVPPVGTDIMECAVARH